MSGRHRRPQPDALADVDLAERIETADVIVTPAPGQPIGPSPGSPAPLSRAAPADPVGLGDRVDPPHPPVAPSSAARNGGGPAVAARAPAHAMSGPAASARSPIAASAPADAVGGPTVIARRDRAAERAARRNAARRRYLAVAAVVGAVLVVVVGIWWLTGRGGDDAAPVAGSTVPKQQTLLVQVASDDGVAVGNALLGVTPADKRAATVLVPSRLIVDVAGAGMLPFGETVTLPAETASSDALTDLLGVRIDGSWVLTKPALAALVDEVGGVQAEVDVDVLAKDAQGRETVVVRAGTDKLDGAAAAAFATYAAEGEQEQARLVRYNDVLDAVLRKLPEDPVEVAKILQGLGDGSQSTASAAELARTLVAVRSAASAKGLSSELLPVNEIDSGESLESYGIAAGDAADLMRSRFPGALQTDAAGESVRVLVENGVGTPDLVPSARTMLVDDGYRFINGGNAANFGVDESLVLIPDGTLKSQRRGARVAASLGLPKDSVAVSSRGQSVADVIVILGADFGS